MIDKQRLAEIYKSVVDWLCLVWNELKSALQSFSKQQPDSGDKPANPDANKSKFWLYAILGIFVLSLLAGGELLTYGARTIAAGGCASIASLYSITRLRGFRRSRRGDDRPADERQPAEPPPQLHLAAEGADAAMSALSASPSPT